MHTTPRTRPRIAARAAVTGALLSLLLSACGGGTAGGAGGESAAPGADRRSIILDHPEPGRHATASSSSGWTAPRPPPRSSARSSSSTRAPTRPHPQNVDAAVAGQADARSSASASHFDDVFATVPKQHPASSSCRSTPAPRTAAAEPHLRCRSRSTRPPTSPVSRPGCPPRAGRSAWSRRSTRRSSTAGSTRSSPGRQVGQRQVTGTALYVGGNNPFSDPARAKAQAQTLDRPRRRRDPGRRVRRQPGVFEAAAAAGASRRSASTSTSARAAPGTVIDNVLKRVDVARGRGDQGDPRRQGRRRPRSTASPRTASA